MNEKQRRINATRAGLSELENHYVDELFAGRINRRRFLQGASYIGMGAAAAAFLAACSSGSSGSSTTTTAAGAASNIKAGGTMTVASIVPTSTLDPITVDDQGGLCMLGQAGEYLTWSDPTLTLQPSLATSWKPNSDGSVWTFTIRSGVKFNDGSPMTAADVVKSLQTQCNTKNGGNALSAFGGVLEPSGVEMVNSTTVACHLVSPNGSFPALVSSDNYNMIILPASYNYGGKYNFEGTGAWKNTGYTAQVQATFAKNPDWWGKTSSVPYLDTSTFKFYTSDSPQILALESGSVNAMAQFSASDGQALFTNPNIKVLSLRSSAHREISLRNDVAPFTNKLVRQAMGLSLNRPQLITGLLDGKADLGNDSPFAPVFPETNPSIPQRVQNISKAKSMVSAANVGSAVIQGASINTAEIPLLAQAVESAAKQIGLNIKITVENGTTYYGDAVFGKSPWLDATVSIVDYGHRGVPNVFLNAPLVSTGTWNAAHFKNSQYDSLVKQYIAALDLQAQRSAAGKIQTLLLDETPIIFPYFYYYLAATKSTIAGFEVTAIGHARLNSAGFTS